MKFDTMGLEENNMNLKIQNLRLLGGGGGGWGGGGGRGGGSDT